MYQFLLISPPLARGINEQSHIDRNFILWSLRGPCVLLGKLLSATRPVKKDKRNWFSENLIRRWTCILDARLKTLQWIVVEITTKSGETLVVIKNLHFLIGTHHRHEIYATSRFSDAESGYALFSEQINLFGLRTFSGFSGVFTTFVVRKLWYDNEWLSLT